MHGAVRDQHRFGGLPGLGGDAPAVPSVGRVQGVDRAEVVGQVHAAAGDRGPRRERGAAEESGGRLEVPAHLAAREVDRQHPRPGGDVHGAVRRGQQPHRDAAAGGRVADRVRPALGARTGLQRLQPPVGPDEDGALVQDRPQVGGLEVGLDAAGLPQPFAGGRFPGLHAAAPGGGDDGAPVGLERVDPAVAGQAPALGAVGGVERVQARPVGGVDTAVRDGHAPGHVAGLELAAATGDIEGVHLEGGDVQQVAGDRGRAPHVVGHAEPPGAPAGGRGTSGGTARAGGGRAGAVSRRGALLRQVRARVAFVGAVAGAARRARGRPDPVRGGCLGALLRRSAVPGAGAGAYRR